MEQHIVEHSKFFEPLLGECKREPRSVNREIVLLEYVSEGSDVIFVPVRQDQCGEVVAILL
jgi:hypothetical protein